MVSKEKSPGGFSGCGKRLPVETWIASDAGLLDPTTNLDRVLQRVAPFLPGQHVVVIDGADLDLQMKVATDHVADRIDDLQQKARAIVQAAAVVVLAVVDGGAEELGDQIAVGGMQLDAVEPGLLGAPSAEGECLDRLLDLGTRHGATEKAVQRLALASRARR